MRHKRAGRCDPEVVLDGGASYRKEKRGENSYRTCYRSANPLRNGDGDSAYDHLPA